VHRGFWPSGRGKVSLPLSPGFESQRARLSPPRCLTCLLGLQGVQWIRGLVVMGVSWSGHPRLKKKKKKNLNIKWNKILFQVVIWCEIKYQVQCRMANVMLFLDQIHVLLINIEVNSLWSIEYLMFVCFFKAVCQIFLNIIYYLLFKFLCSTPRRLVRRQFFCLFTPSLLPADIYLKKEKLLPQRKQQFFSVAGEPGRWRL